MVCVSKCNPCIVNIRYTPLCPFITFYVNLIINKMWMLQHVDVIFLQIGILTVDKSLICFAIYKMRDLFVPPFPTEVHLLDSNIFK